MYEVLSKLREYQFRLRLYDMNRSEVVKSSLLDMFKNDPKNTEITASSSLADMLLPTFQKYLNTRDITNFLMRTSSVDTLMVPDAPIK
jgi:hypothetical protein